MSKHYYLGVDIGGTNLKGGIVDEKDGTLLIKHAMPIEARKGGKDVLERLLDFVDHFDSAMRQKSLRISAIGIGTPGAVSERKGGVHYGAANLPGWCGIPFIKEVKKSFKIPTFAHNDATLAAMAEVKFGVAKNKRHVICITLGTGIGGGLIIDGKIYDGATGFAGEIGHMSIVPNGRKCSCGKRGCWEAYASATAVIDMAREQARHDQDSYLYKKFLWNWDHLEAKDVYDACHKKDKVAQEVVKTVGHYLGMGMANLVNIFNPEMLVLSGGMSNDKFLRSTYQTTFRNGCADLAYRSVRVLKSHFKCNMGIMGAAAYAIVRSKE